MYWDNITFIKSQSNVFVFHNHFTNKSEGSIYNNNIAQKKGNSIILILHHNGIKYEYSNFTYTSDDRYLIILSLQYELIIYDNLKLEIVKKIPLRDYVLDWASFKTDFIRVDKRSFIKQLFTRLSFLHWNQETNTIYANNKLNILILFSLNRKRFYALTKWTKEKDYSIQHYTISEIMHNISLRHFEFNSWIKRENVKCGKVLNDDWLIKMDAHDFGINYYWLSDTNNNILIVILQENSWKIFKWNLTHSVGWAYSMENTMELKWNNTNKEWKSISLWAKVDNRRWIISITYDKESFEWFLVNLEFKSFKRISSNEVKRKLFQEDKELIIDNFNIITDIFVKPKHYVLIVNFNYFWVLSKDDQQFSVFNYNQFSSKYYVDLNHVFKGEYNKCLYWDIIRNEKNENLMKIVVMTKKGNKELTFKYDRYVMKRKTGNYLTDLLAISNPDNSLALSLGDSIAIASKNRKWWMEYKRNDPFIWSLVNNKIHSGVLTKALKYFVSTFNINLFRDLNFVNVENIKPHTKAVSNNEKCNFYLIKYTCNYLIDNIILFLFTELFQRQRDMKKISVIISTLFKSKSERYSILQCIRTNIICFYNKIKTKTHKILHDEDICNKTDYLSKLKAAVKRGNWIHFFELINSNKKQLSISKFYWYVIARYYKQIWDHNQQRTFYKFNANDIIIALDNNEPYRIILRNFFTKPTRISFNSVQCVDYLMDLINLILNTKNEQLSNINSISHIYIYDRINELLQLHYKDISIKSTLFVSSQPERKCESVFSKEIIKSIMSNSNFTNNNEESIRFFIYVYELNIMSRIGKIRELLIQSYFKSLNYNFTSQLNRWIRKFTEVKLYNLQYKHKKAFNSNLPNNSFSSFTLFLSSFKNINIVNEELNNIINQLFMTCKISFEFVTFVLNKTKNKEKAVRYFLDLDATPKKKGDNVRIYNYFEANEPKKANKHNSMSTHFKAFVINLYMSMFCWYTLNIINKNVLQPSDNVLLIISLLHLSFYYNTKYLDSAVVFSKEIIEAVDMYRLSNENNSMLYSYFFLFGNIECSPWSDKINNIKEYIKGNKSNGNWNVWLNTNAVKEKYWQSKKNSGFTRINNKDIFTFIRGNDVTFDMFLNNFWSEWTVNSNRFDVKDYKMYLERIDKENRFVFGYLNNIIQLPKFLNTWSNSNNKEDHPLLSNRDNNPGKDQEISKKKWNELDNRINNILKFSAKRVWSRRLNVNLRVVVNDNDSACERRVDDEVKDTSIINNDTTVYNQSNNDSVSERRVEDEVKDTSIINNDTTIYNQSNREVPQLEPGGSRHFTFQNISKSPRSEVFGKRNSFLKSKEEIKQNSNFRFTEEHIKMKYVSLKLMWKYFENKDNISKDYVFRYLKGKYFVNYTNIITKEANLSLTRCNSNITTNISERNDITDKWEGHSMYPKLKIRKKNNK